jgi:hypothetical protein
MDREEPERGLWIVHCESNLKGAPKALLSFAEPATNKHNVILTPIGDSDDGVVVTSLGEFAQADSLWICRTELRAIGIDG